jgi:hypothetical protein
MRKKTRRPITNSEPKNQRRLELSRETVRVIGADELSGAVGGSGCSSTSYTTEQTSHR